MRNKNITTVYAWQIKEGLCWSVKRERQWFKEDDKPSPEAEIKKCILMTYGEYLKLKELARTGALFK